jgi:pimeloyl-ACP methyl ester carboxylesterase
LYFNIPSRILAATVLVGAGLLPADVSAADPARFSVSVTGQGPDVVLIPGLATPGAVWDATVKHLAPTHRVHVITVAGFGSLDGGPNKTDGEMLPAVIAEMVQYVTALKRPALIGHSLGGLIALEVAAVKPDAIGRLLVVDALPFYALIMNPAATVETAAKMAAMMRNQTMKQTDAQFAAGAQLTAARLAKSEPARASVAKWTAASDRTVFEKAMYEDIVTDARPRLPAIKTKTTVLYAFDATMGIPQGAVDSMYSGAYRGLAGVDLKRIDDSYHFIMLDQPQAFLREVDAFLRLQ